MPFSWKKYSLYLCSILAAFYVLGYVVDPLGLNFQFTHPTLNAIKPAAVGFEHKLKPFRINAVQPQTLILGNSRVAYGVNPEKLKGFPQPVFNAAIEFGQLREMVQFLEYAIEVAPLREAVLFLEYYNFSTTTDIRDFYPIFPTRGGYDLLQAHSLAYVSSDALLGIFQTLFSNLTMKHLKGTTKTGYVLNNMESNFQPADPDTRRSLVTQEAQIVLDHNPGIQTVREIQALCNKHNITLHAILGPFPQEQIAMRKTLGTWSPILKWKADLQKEIDYTDYYHEHVPYTAEDFYDRIHFTVDIGVEMVNALKMQIAHVPVK